ncbi:hypothetical protein WBJ53_25920 [Spirosoma sp. SC4-14]|uniref:hypothetical protein n=1 Tax=Spirosoma sp. SC4-14 TaxID=3128900 RepID=UPI0030CDD060
MKTKLKTLAPALLAAVFSIPYVHAQAPAEPTAPTPPAIVLNAPGPDRPGRFDRQQPGGHVRHTGRKHLPNGSGRFGRGGALTALTSVTGTVGQWTSNDDGILDGFTLSDSPTTIKFPPHLGEQVQKALKPGSAVSVTGYTEASPEGSRFHMTSLMAGKTTVVSGPPVVSATPPAPPALVTETGKITDYRFGRDGRVNGFVLDNKTIVRVPPHVAYQLTNLVTKGSTITVQGYSKNLRDGQVQLSKINSLNASVLTINGQQYLVR